MLKTEMYMLKKGILHVKNERLLSKFVSLSRRNIREKVRFTLSDKILYNGKSFINLAM